MVELKMSPREQPRVTVTEPAEHRAVLTLFCSYSVSFWLGLEGIVEVNRGTVSMVVFIQMKPDI